MDEWTLTLGVRDRFLPQMEKFKISLGSRMRGEGSRRLIDGFRLHHDKETSEHFIISVTYMIIAEAFVSHGQNLKLFSPYLAG